MTLEEFLKIKNPTVEDFCNLENADKFDFSNDSASHAYQFITDSLEKYFVYKAVNICENSWKKGDKRKYRDGIVYPAGLLFSKYATDKCGMVKDPDSHSPLLQEIYPQLWDNKHLTDCTYGGKITGETLNSAQTTLNTTIEKFNIGTYYKCYGNYSIKYAISLYAAFRDALFNELNSVDGLRKFLAVYHTLGNFMPVPVNCNCPRGTGSTKDYWDLALEIIHAYYTKDSADIKVYEKIECIVGANLELQKAYKKWLDSFIDGGDQKTGWKNFIEKNFLQDFVNINADGEYSEPKELWEGHFSKMCWKNRKFVGWELPRKRDIKQFYTNASSWILARGNRMLIALEKKMSEEENKVKEDE